MSIEIRILIASLLIILVNSTALAVDDTSWYSNIFYALSLFTVIGITYYLHSYLNAAYQPPKAGRTCARMSKADYSRQAYTVYKLDQLYNSSQYKSALREKGRNKVNWNWQSRQMYKKSLNIPLSPYSSDEDKLSDY